jgi:membrane fusion protein, heavy metal efflux system
MRRAIAVLAMLASVCVGCRKNHESAGAVHDHDDHGHSHGAEAQNELKTAQITVWTNGYEIFAEHTPPIVGRATRIITHVSELWSGKPRSAGGIKFVFRQGRESFEHPHAAPDRPGIYVPAITFPKDGEWQAGVVVETNAFVELGMVRVFATEEAAVRAEFPEAPEGISFLKEQQWKLLVKTAPMMRRTLVECVSVPGQVRAKPGTSAAVTAPFAGQLSGRPGEAFPNPGRRVDDGDLLGLIRPRFSEAAARFFENQGEFQAATAALKQAESVYERTKSLVAVEAKSRRDLEEAEVALASARARLSAAAALHSDHKAETNGALATIELRAPIAGVITSVNAGVGEPVAADQTLFTILDLSTVWIEARVPESAFGRLGAAKDALCQLLDGSNRQFPISADNGRLVFSGLEVDAQTRTVPLIYEMNNTNAMLRAGQSVRLHVETARALESASIPHSALVEEGGMFVVFVQISGETFKRREVQLGIRDGEWIQVVAGLSPGERVVTDGAYAIRLAAASSAIPSHGHAH